MLRVAKQPVRNVEVGQSYCLLRWALDRAGDSPDGNELLEPAVRRILKEFFDGHYRLLQYLVVVDDECKILQSNGTAHRDTVVYIVAEAVVVMLVASFLDALKEKLEQERPIKLLNDSLNWLTSSLCSVQVFTLLIEQEVPHLDGKQGDLLAGIVALSSGVHE